MKWTVQGVEPPVQKTKGGSVLPLFSTGHLLTNSLNVLLPLRPVLNLNEDAQTHEVQYLVCQVLSSSVDSGDA